MDTKILYHGTFSSSLVRRAHPGTEKTLELGEQYENRLFRDSARRSGIRLVRCPSFMFAEKSDICILRAWDSPEIPNIIPFAFHHSSRSHFPITIFFITLVLSLHSNISSLWDHDFLVSAQASYAVSPNDFNANRQSVGLASCLICGKIWQDPYSSDGSTAQSLRLAIQAARTIAIEMTYSQCGLDFIKESGCNKLVYMCGMW